MTIRSGHPDFLDLDWTLPLAQWPGSRTLAMPTGRHRHPIAFVPYEHAIYVVKELPLPAARNEHAVLRRLEGLRAPAVVPVGLVERPWLPADDEDAAAVITRYAEFSFSYRELISEGGFGPRRNQMLDGFAGLLVQLHLLGCYWGDCSLSNVIYRYDADAIEVIMLDAETAAVHERLSDGQRLEDLEIMVENVAGGMADIAASQGRGLDAADLELGRDIEARYRGLWDELHRDLSIRPDETYRIRERIRRLNEMGFEVEGVELSPGGDSGSQMRMRLRVGGRSFHARRLHELTQLDVPENQARQVLADLRYFEAKLAGSGQSPAVVAMRWRVEVLEPLLARMRQVVGEGEDPVQGYCDLLHHRYMLSVDRQTDVGNDEAFAHWLGSGRPGYPLE
ncbi:MAG: DUF4032 domain-containing protein [Myxococcales bacterium]|nr:DUF4032 domain-containing protein [Myxococcales bacterium]MCB9716436.1 DUF4032 domain-containing protein [Myxococcales bacterium]